jgi:hypothetical protein
MLLIVFDVKGNKSTLWGSQGLTGNLTALD